MRTIQSCYEHEINSAPWLSGRVDIRFVIGTSGRVTRAEVTKSNLPATMGDCICTALTNVALPFGLKEPVTVSFPFTFSPGR